MTALGDVSLLLELLDRQFAYVLALNGTARLSRLPHLLSFLDEEPRIAGLLQDFGAEAANARAAYRRADHVVRRELSRLWEANCAEIQATLRTVSDEALNAHGTMQDYEARLGKRTKVVLPDHGVQTARERETECSLLALRHWTSWALNAAKASGSEASAALLGLGPTLTRLARIHEHACRALQQAGRSLPWAAYRRLAYHAKLANPKPPRTADVRAWIRHEELLSFARTLRQADEVDVGMAEQHDVDELYSSTESDARLLHEELRHRIGLGRSRLAIIQRYAAKCEAFDAPDLRELCAGDTRNAERHLTLHLARYVFDHGLLPLLDPTIGGLRPDVLHIGAGSPLYVEAKQYSGRSPKSGIVRAYSQVWSTWSRVRKFSPVTEAFLVVFRRGGPLVKLPATVRHDGATLHSVLVDISTTGGSKEKGKVVHIAESDLLPG